MKNRSKVSMIENVKINKSMSDFDATKIKVIFMDIGGVLLINGQGYELRQKAAQVFDY